MVRCGKFLHFFDPRPKLAEDDTDDSQCTFRWINSNPCFEVHRTDDNASHKRRHTRFSKEWIPRVWFIFMFHEIDIVLILQLLNWSTLLIGPLFCIPPPLLPLAPTVSFPKADRTVLILSQTWSTLFQDDKILIECPTREHSHWTSKSSARLFFLTENAVEVSFFAICLLLHRSRRVTVALCVYCLFKAFRTLKSRPPRMGPGIPRRKVSCKPSWVKVVLRGFSCNSPKKWGKTVDPLSTPLHVIKCIVGNGQSGDLIWLWFTALHKHIYL